MMRSAFYFEIASSYPPYSTLIIDLMVGTSVIL